MVKLRDEQKAELIKQERERRRVARLRQVRQQSAAHAKVIREVVSQKKREIIEDIRAELHEEVRVMIEEENDKHLPTPKSRKRKTMTPKSPKKKPSRRREMTENDLKLAKIRNSEALRRLRESKKRAADEKMEKTEKRRKAAQKATEISRGAQIL